MKVCEKDVSRIWQDGRLRWLRDDAGNDVEVVYGGRPAVKPGCDFQDAVLRINGVKCCGDVEIHVTSDLWKKHGHHRNPAYNNVILHVVMWEKGGLPVFMHSGKNVPTVILNADAMQIGGLPAGGCPHAKPENGLREILTACGLERLYGKSREFAGLMCSEPPQQALYRGICRALGYASNKLQMEKLAVMLPIFRWQRSAAGSGAAKRALVIGTAGLLPSQRGGPCSGMRDDEALILEKEWCGIRDDVRPMQKQEWCFAGVRPANSPLRRVAALYGLIEKLGTGWLEYFQGLIEVTDMRRAEVTIEKNLVINDIDYWSHHYDFGMKLARPMSVLGNGRAREITINVILPFYLTYAVSMEDHAIINKIIDIYTGYPVLPENEITRFMKLQLMPEERDCSNGCRQQGLIYIFQTCCRTRDCEKCPVVKTRRQGWG